MEKADIDYFIDRLVEELKPLIKQEFTSTDLHPLEARVQALEERITSMSDRVALRQAFTGR